MAPVIDCKTCGAHLSTAHIGCPYCGALVVPDRVLEPRQEDELAEVAKTMEAKLEELKGRHDGEVVATLVICVACVIGSYFAVRDRVDLLPLVLIETLLFFVSVMIFGWVIGIAERKALETAYRGQLRQEIDLFLLTKGYYRCEFDTLASKRLEKDAKLRRFLFEKPERLPGGPALAH